MKRLVLLIISTLILLISPALSAVAVSASTTDTSSQETSEQEWPEGPSVHAEAAIVMEASTGLILYEKNINETYYPASITKIMTALLAIENSSMGDVVTFSKSAVFDVDLDSSRIGIDVGEQLTMQQCLYGMLLESANEVTHAVAEFVSGDVDSFASLMNERAKSIGCKNTHFMNPHGLPDENHYTTAYDMALITRESMKNEAFRKIFATRTYQIPPTNLQSETRYLRNHHKFVLNQGYTYDGCIGGKTGYTSVAKYTLVSVAKRGDLELICVIMKDDSSAHQYTDTQNLFDFAYENFSIYPIADMEDTQTSNESPLFTKYNSLLSKSNTPIITDDKGYLVLPNSASLKDAQREVVFFPASEQKDNGVIGKISYTYNNKYVGGADILYHGEDKLKLTPVETQQNNPTTIPEETTVEKADSSLRPIILGIIVGLFLIIITLYYILVERPRLKRRNAYYKKRARRRSYRNDEFLDL